MFKAKVYIRMKQGLLDPQGKAIEGAFTSLGILGAEHVSVGRLIEFKLAAKSKDDADKKITDMCKKLLANPVIETFSYDLEEVVK
jgi:phosphoribosylformylglycinamidine synthase subunit PurS